MPFCGICGEETSSTTKCVVCGDRFCMDCGDVDEKTCIYCLDEDNLYDDDDEDYDDDYDDDTDYN